MKALKRDLQSMIKSLKSATEKAEKMARKLEGAENIQTAKKRTAKSAGAPTRKKAETSATDTVLSIIKRQKKGIDTAAIKKKTDFDTKTIRNVIFRLKKQGKIQAAARGVYMAV